MSFGSGCWPPPQVGVSQRWPVSPEIRHGDAAPMERPAWYPPDKGPENFLGVGYSRVEPMYSRPGSARRLIGSQKDPWRPSFPPKTSVGSTTSRRRGTRTKPQLRASYSQGDLRRSQNIEVDYEQNIHGAGPVLAGSLEIALPCTNCGHEVTLFWPPPALASPEVVPTRMEARCDVCQAAVCAVEYSGDGVYRAIPRATGKPAKGPTHAPEPVDRFGRPTNLRSQGANRFMPPRRGTGARPRKELPFGRTRSSSVSASRPGSGSGGGRATAAGAARWRQRNRVENDAPCQPRSTENLGTWMSGIDTRDVQGDVIRHGAFHSDRFFGTQSLEQEFNSSCEQQAASEPITVLEQVPMARANVAPRTAGPLRFSVLQPAAGIRTSFASCDEEIRPKTPVWGDHARRRYVGTGVKDALVGWVKTPE